MNEETRECAERATVPAPSSAPFINELALLGALVGLTQALHTQTQYLAQLTVNLSTLTENLVCLLDNIEAQSNDDEQFATLS